MVIGEYVNQMIYGMTTWRPFRASPEYLCVLISEAIKLVVDERER